MSKYRTKKRAVYLPVDSELSMFIDDYIISGEGFTYTARNCLMEILFRIVHSVYFNTKVDEPNSNTLIYFINLVREKYDSGKSIDILDMETIGDIIRDIGRRELSKEESNMVAMFGMRLDKIITSLLNTLIENYDVSELLSSRCISCTNSYFVIAN